MNKLLFKLFFPALGLAMANCAYAADGPTPVKPDDYVVIRVGGMYTEVDSTLRGNAPAYGFNQTREIGLGSVFDEKWIPRIEGLVRFGDRHRLIFNYFKYDQDERATLETPIEVANQQIPAGSFVQGGVEFQVASLVYDFEVLNAENVGLGLQLGAEWAKAEATASADLGPVYQGRFLDESTDGVAPVIGIRLTFQPTDRFLINLQGQYLDADWGNFDDYDGDLIRANGIIEYRFADNFGIFAGYDWFKLDIEKGWSGGSIGIEQEFKGPVAGITLAF